MWFDWLKQPILLHSSIERRIHLERAALCVFPLLRMKLLSDCLKLLNVKHTAIRLGKCAMHHKNVIVFKVGPVPDVAWVCLLVLSKYLLLKASLAMFNSRIHIS